MAAARDRGRRLLRRLLRRSHLGPTLVPASTVSPPPAGVVFEAFDRQGQLRAIAGGGRYDQLLATFGGEAQPCAGFGFGDAVITELLMERNLLPDLQHEVPHPHSMRSILDHQSGFKAAEGCSFWRPRHYGTPHGAQPAPDLQHEVGLFSLVSIIEEIQRLQPCAGFGCGAAVITELPMERDRLPDLQH